MELGVVLLDSKHLQTQKQIIPVKLHQQVLQESKPQTFRHYSTGICVSSAEWRTYHDWAAVVVVAGDERHAVGELGGELVGHDVICLAQRKKAGPGPVSIFTKPKTQRTIIPT